MTDETNYGQTWDLLDRQVLHALQIDGRVPLSRMADVLGSTNRTVARRYLRLREAGMVRVLGRPDAGRIGQAEWVLRLRCPPERSFPIARSLAARADTYWVRLASGGTEVAWKVQVEDGSEYDPLGLDDLPPNCEGASVLPHLVLHRFTGESDHPQHGVASVLSPEQIRQLARPAVDPVALAEPITPGGEDRVIFDLLALDGRASNAELASAVGWHESTVRRRISRLRANGVLRFTVDVDELFLDPAGLALLWMWVKPDQLVAVGRTLARQREIAFVAATTGRTNLLAAVVYEDNEALYENITGHLGLLHDIHVIEITPVTRTLKREGRDLTI